MVRPDKGKAVSLWLSAIVLIFVGVFNWAGSEPTWWGVALPLVTAMAEVIFGKPWKPPLVDD